MGKIDTKSRWLRVVETIPVRHGWLDHAPTNLCLVVEPLKTSLDSMVRPISAWLTMTTYLLGAYLLTGKGTYLLALNGTYLLEGCK